MPGSSRSMGLLLVGALLLSATAQAKDPFEPDDKPVERAAAPARPYRPGTLGLGFSINPFFFLDVKNGLDLGPTIKVFLPASIPIAFQTTFGILPLTSGIIGGNVDI